MAQVYDKYGSQGWMSTYDVHILMLTHYSKHSLLRHFEILQGASLTRNSFEDVCFASVGAAVAKPF